MARIGGGHFVLLDAVGLPFFVGMMRIRKRSGQGSVSNNFGMGVSASAQAVIRFLLLSGIFQPNTIPPLVWRVLYRSVVEIEGIHIDERLHFDTIRKARADPFRSAPHPFAEATEVVSTGKLRLMLGKRQRKILPIGYPWYPDTRGKSLLKKQERHPERLRPACPTQAGGAGRRRLTW
jgi:hypothetical protein